MAGEAAPPEEEPQAEGVVGAKGTRGTALAGAAALSQDAATREAIPKGAAATSQAAATRVTTSGGAAVPRQAEATREATLEEATSLAEGAIRVAVSSSCRYPPPAWFCKQGDLAWSRLPGLWECCLQGDDHSSQRK